ncbi:hypothetical protein GWL_16210 [Herbaspirillum sp. GW103]|uniref:DUF6314 family protein n=1 Tax=unclassified Herbaspirillum TaxID=2624150 RepID=UPI00025E4BF5|nr:MULTISPECIES: DUF6314 family protein [unclassified Herbaspirillum]EIJ47380.1 hypothetical protein GWL_16210 [Herbaspirillum sp. GW103]MCI1004939.1 hypothetical protein [Herbaspirillum sp. C7C8]
MAVFPPKDMAAMADYFRGEWLFTRTIWEGSASPQATATGELSFTTGALPGQLIYREQGQLRMVAAPARLIPFTRVFDYRFSADRLAVLFADGERIGQPYQDYLLQGQALMPAADHLCGPDCYTAAYTAHSENSFTMDTSIQGPRKRTRVLTEFSRRFSLSASPA